MREQEKLAELFWSSGTQGSEPLYQHRRMRVEFHTYHRSDRCPNLQNRPTQ